MRIISTTCALLLIFAGLAFAETWTGKLVDANCAEQDKTAACTPTSSTTAFALSAEGKMLKLDAAGNTKAAEALKSRADRAKDPAAPTKETEVRATVSGTLEGDTVKVESISLQ